MSAILKSTIILFLQLSFSGVAKSQEIKQTASTKDSYFSIIGEEKKDDDGKIYYEINGINIFSKKTKSKTQIIEGLSIKYVYANPIVETLKASELLIVQDINFDGNLDIRIVNSYNDPTYYDYAIWLYDGLSSKFYESKLFDSISSCLTIDEEKHEIHNFIWSDNKSIVGIYKVNNNIPVLHRTTERDFFTNGDCCDTYNYYERGEDESDLKKIKTYRQKSFPMKKPNKLSSIVKLLNSDSLLHYFGINTIISSQPEVPEYDIPEGFIYTIYTGGRTDISEKVSFMVSKEGSIIEAILNSPTTFWKLPLGIKYGMTISELVKLNGKPISISGFETDHSGQVNWNGGKIQGKGISVEIGYKGNIASSFTGDNVKISSENPKLKMLNLFVNSITIRKEVDVNVSSKKIIWKTFNHKYGFSLQLPYYFKVGSLTASSIQYYINEQNDNISLNVFTNGIGSKEILKKSYQSLLNATLGCDYKILGDNYFIISGQNEDGIYFIKEFIKNQQTHTLSIFYPLNEKDNFGPLIPEIVKSFH